MFETDGMGGGQIPPDDRRDVLVMFLVAAALVLAITAITGGVNG